MKPKNESKRDRFVRVAEACTAKIISMIRLLGNCSNKSVYEYQAKDLKKIFKAIDDALEDAQMRYSMSRQGTKDVFSLE